MRDTVYDPTKSGKNAVFKHENKELDRRIGQRNSNFPNCVLPRSSHTKLEKIMKELDEEVKCPLCFFTASCIIFQLGQ